MKKPIIYIVTGKTGGHLYPALAVEEALSEQHAFSVLFITTTSGLDKTVLSEQNKPVYSLRVPSSTHSVIRKIAVQFSTFLRTGIFLCRKRPRVIIGFGGVLSFSVVLWGRLLHIPSLIHEPNMYPGKANRFLSGFATSISLGYDPLTAYFPSSKSFVSGVPVRKIVTGHNQINTDFFPGSDRDKRTLLVMGGSQGAHSVNRLIIACKSLFIPLKDKLQIIHITGENDYAEIQRQTKEYEFFWRTIPFLKEMDKALIISDLYIGRSGASIIAELLAAEVPGILIPYPYAKDNHQQKNACYFAEKGAFRWLKERDATPEILVDILKETLFNEHTWEQMKKACGKLARHNAAEVLANKIVQLAKK